MLRGGNSYSIKRNPEEEEKFICLLKGLHASFEKQRNVCFFITLEDARKKQWFLKTYHLLLDLNVSLAGMDMLRHFRYSEFKPETEYQIIEETGNEILIKLRVRFGKEEIPLNKQQRILIGGQHHFLLKDDKIAILDEHWLKKYATIIIHGHIRDNEIRLERWLAISHNEGNAEQGLLRPIFKVSKKSSS